jgi:site-specific DNA recombinase
MGGAMGESDKTPRRSAKKARCAIYTRKSSEEGLEQAFNSLDAQREACAAFFAWTADPNKIIAAVKRGHQVLDSIH